MIIKDRAKATRTRAQIKTALTSRCAYRDGPLEKLWGGGGGGGGGGAGGGGWQIFQPQEFFFVLKFLV